MGRAPTAAEERPSGLSRRTLFAYSAFRFGDILMMQIIGTFLRLFYVTTYAIPPHWIAFIHPLLKTFDAVTDPVLGKLSDDTRSRMGRRRPYILFGGIGVAVAFALFWNPAAVLFWVSQPSIGGLFTVYCVIYVFYYALHTVAVVPYYALGAELSSDYDERTRITAWRNVIALPGALLAALTYKLATDPRLFPEGDRAGMAVCGLVVAGIIAALASVTAVATPEPRSARSATGMPMRQALAVTFSNRPFIRLAGSVFFFQMAYLFAMEFHTYVVIYAMFGGDKARFGELFLEGMAAALVAAVVVNFWARGLARRRGKKAAFTLFAFTGLLLPIASLVAFDASAPRLYLLFTIAMGICATGFEILSFSMVADICDLDEVETGRRREGAFMGAYNGIFKAGLMLSPVLSNLLLHYYCRLDQQLIQAGLPQAADTLGRLRIALFGVTTCIFLAAGASALLVPIRRRDVEAAQAELERRSSSKISKGG